MLLFVPILLACAIVQPRDILPTPTRPAPTDPPASRPTAEPTSTLVPAPASPSTFPDPAAYAWDPVVSGLRSPVDIQNAGDARLFIVEQRGVIRVLEESGLREEPFLDIRDNVFDTGNEQGLLGLAFSPNYVADGFFFVNYTGGTGDTVISRFRVGPDPNRADSESEAVLLTFGQPYANHNGGGMVFGPDGYLYVGTGDGGGQGDPERRAQNRDSLLGKILRLDVLGGEPYTVPPDNPFASGGGRPEVWALGLRNPWRSAFDTATGDYYIADVGQSQWEEVNVLLGGSPAGANFGWDLREGWASYEGDSSPAFTDPVAVYSHAEGGCSVTGGGVVRDPALPEWQGIYLYGDFCSGLIWGLFRDPGGSWQNRLLFSTGFQITSFGSGSDDAVYVLDRSGGVYRLTGP
jgi:glucose/arabinose dehydrogenase